MTRRKKSHSQTTRWKRVASVWIISLLIAFAALPQKHVPATLAKNDVVIGAYKWRAKAFEAAGFQTPAQKAANVEPAAGQGYNKHDRQELDSLIGKGNY